MLTTHCSIHPPTQRKNCKEPVRCVDMNLVTSFCFIFESLCKTEKGVDFTIEDDKLIKTIEQLFAFAFVWSVGGSIDHGSWDKFDNFVKDTFDEGGLSVSFPPTDTVGNHVQINQRKHTRTRLCAHRTCVPGSQVFDYFVDIKEHEFVAWCGPEIHLMLQKLRICIELPHR